jgi:hypothetical protein
LIQRIDIDYQVPTALESQNPSFDSPIGAVFQVFERRHGKLMNISTDLVFDRGRSVEVSFSNIQYPK